MLGRSFFVFMGLALAACGGSGNSGGTPNGDPNNPCPKGEAPAPSSGECIPAAPASCPVGTMPQVGNTQCVPVGVGECAKGFTRDARGWACIPIAADSCAGAERAKLGSASCVPVGDCDAAFPPKGATHFVSPSGASDATHFRTVRAAIAAAPAGSVIAIDDGTYEESLAVTRAVTLVGRCAERVKLDGARLSNPGIHVAASKVSVRGLTVARYLRGAVVESGELDLEDVVIDSNDALGVEATPDTKLVMKGSVVRKSRGASGLNGFGLAFEGATVEVVDSELTENQASAINGGNSGELLVEDSILSHTAPSNELGEGVGVHVSVGGRARIVRSAVTDNVRYGVQVADDTSLELEDVTIARTKAGSAKAGMGLVVAGAHATAQRITLVDNEGLGFAGTRAEAEISDSAIAFPTMAPGNVLGNGVYLINGTTLRIARSAVVGSRTAGIELWQDGTTALVDRSLVMGTLGKDDGLYGDGLVVSNGASTIITASSFIDNRQAGVYVAVKGSATLARTLVRATRREDFENRLGHGVMVLDAVNVGIDASRIESSAAIGLAVGNTRVLVSKSVLLQNAIGVFAQEGSNLREVKELPGKGNERDVFITSDTRFIGNQSRVGSGLLSLPPPPNVGGGSL